MSRKTKAITFTRVNEVSIKEHNLAEVGPADVVVAARYSMVSSGTELRVLGGHYGAVNNYPLIPGYSSVGEVIEVAPEAAGFRVGDLVSCRNPQAVPGVNRMWGGQAAVQVHVSNREDRPVLLPAGAELLDFAAAEISAISLRGVTGADPKPGETAVVLGQA